MPWLEITFFELYKNRFDLNKKKYKRYFSFLVYTILNQFSVELSWKLENQKYVIQVKFVSKSWVIWKHHIENIINIYGIVSFHKNNGNIKFKNASFKRFLKHG